jgi:hypothetical protein
MSRRPRRNRTPAGLGATDWPRLAAKYGPEIDLDELLDKLTQDCPWRDDKKPGKAIGR